MEGQRAAESLTGIRYKWLPKHKAQGKEQPFEDREARESGPTKLREAQAQGDEQGTFLTISSFEEEEK